MTDRDKSGRDGGDGGGNKPPPNILDLIEIKKRKEKPPRGPVREDPIGAHQHFRPLGHDHDRFYFFTASGLQIRELSASKLGKKSELLTLAPLDWWEREFATDNGFSGRAVDMATNYLIQACRQHGVFSLDRRRGRGVWRDSGHIVIHAGDRLYIDGVETALIAAQTEAVYEQQAAIAISLADPLPVAESRRLIDLGQTLNFEVSAHGRMWSGWIVIALASGALSWRPHGFLNGPKGCGKTSVVAITAALLGRFCLSVTGGTSAAGLRQALACDALPVVFDEAEGDSQRASANMDDVLAMMRHSSAGFDAKVIKGGQDGRASATTIQSCFMLSAIRDPIVQAADLSRVTVFTLRPATPISARIWRVEASPLAAQLCAEPWVRRFHGRVFMLLPQLLASIEVFRRTAAERFREQRMGDQIGTLLAGAWILEHDRPPTDEEARQELETLNFDDQEVLLEEASDEAACLRAILEAHIRVDGAEWRGDASIGELVEFVRTGAPQDAPGDIRRSEAERALALYGMRVSEDKKRLLISNTNGMLARKVMTYTGWPRGWGKLLARLPGAEKPDKTIKIGGHPSRCVSVPISDT